jgi:hypothetical protein
MEVVMKKLLFAIFVMSVSIIGCDVPYSGPMLTVNDVDRYLKSMGKDTVCVQDGFDSVCLRVVVQEAEKSEEDVPIIHVHPTGIMYEFYYEDRLILRAERGMDTTQIAQELIDTGKVQLPLDAEQLGAGGDQDGNGDDENAFEGWTIQIYYPPAFPEPERGKTPETSGFDIRVAEGMRFFADGRNDLEIKDFTQVDGADDRRGVQFSVETEASAILIRVGGLVPRHNAKFRINTDGVVSDEDADTFQLQAIQ